MWHQCWIFANPYLKFYITKAWSACKSSVWKGVLFLCLPPPQLHLFWGEAREVQSSRRGNALVLQWEKGFPPGRRCGVVPGDRWTCRAQHWFSRGAGGKLRYPPVPSKAQLRNRRGGVEQGAFHPQNRNCGGQGCTKQECLGGWEVSGKRTRSSSERWHLRRLRLNAELQAANNRRNACSHLQREWVTQSTWNDLGKRMLKTLHLHFGGIH